MKHILNFKGLLLGFIFCQGAQAGQILHFQSAELDPSQSVHRSRPLNRLSQDFVLQFTKKITERDKKDLTASGIQFFHYVPDDALIIRATEAQIQKFSESHDIHGYLPYQGKLKLSLELPTLSVFSTGRTVDVVIHAFTPEDLNRIRQTLLAQPTHAFILDQSKLSLTLRVQQTWLPTISEMNGIEFIEPKAEFQTMLIPLDADSDVTPTPLAGDYRDLSGYETGTKIMKLSAAWDLGYSGEGQKIGIADTGLDTGDLASLSPDFGNAVTKGIGFGTGANGSWSDPMGHGTHVAGSVLGRGTASGRQLRGAASSAQVIVEGMWSPMIDNLTVPQRLSDLFQAAYDEQARIHTNSWGAANESLAGTYDGTAQQTDQFMWDHPDMLILFAAGNSGVDKNKDGRIDPGSVCPPGTAKNVLTVGASENLLSVGGIQVPIKQLRGAATSWGAEPIYSSKVSDNPDGIAMFSSRGPAKDQRTKPEIVAPGTNILSARSHSPGAETLWGEYNKDYVYSGGTSMSTPLTAGAASIVRQILIQKFHIANPSAALIKAVLLHTAKDLFPGQYGTAPGTQELASKRPNSDEGYGRVDLEAVTQLGSHTQFVESSVEQDQEFRISVPVQNGKLLVNLVYTDAPATLSAAKILVNDLDLQILKPAGSPAESDVEVLALPRDSVNNHEIAELTGLASGTYQILVKGTKVPMGRNGKQPFALVYTAD